MIKLLLFKCIVSFMILYDSKASSMVKDNEPKYLNSTFRIF